MPKRCADYRSLFLKIKALPLWVPSMPARNSGRGRLCVVCTRSGTAALATVEEEQYWIIYNLTHKNLTQSNTIQHIEFEANVLGRSEKTSMRWKVQIMIAT